MGQGNAATMFCFLATDLVASCAACAAQGDPHVWILKYGSGDIEALVTTDFVSVGSYTARMSLGKPWQLERCNLEIHFFHPLVALFPTLGVHHILKMPPVALALAEN